MYTDCSLFNYHTTLGFLAIGLVQGLFLSSCYIYSMAYWGISLYLCEKVPFGWRKSLLNIILFLGTKLSAMK